VERVSQGGNMKRFLVAATVAHGIRPAAGGSRGRREGELQEGLQDLPAGKRYTVK
jgi:hypothetical protein